MLYQLTILTLASLAFGAIEAQPQTHVVAGRVMAARTNQPIPVGKVTVQGMGIEDQLRPDGVFILRVPVGRGRITLVASAKGFHTKAVTVPANQETVFIELEPIAVQLSDLVVTAAGTAARRGHLNTTTNLHEALQGKVAGAHIQRNSGVPGGDFDLRIRGVTTILGSTSPLYILDGVIIHGTGVPSGISAIVGGQRPIPSRITDLNPNDIASIEVLKGAAATTMYGSKGTNGVVVIRTKRGWR